SATCLPVRKRSVRTKFQSEDIWLPTTTSASSLCVATAQYSVWPSFVASTTWAPRAKNTKPRTCRSPPARHLGSLNWRQTTSLKKATTRPPAPAQLIIPQFGGYRTLTTSDQVPWLGGLGQAPERACIKDAGPDWADRGHK